MYQKRHYSTMTYFFILSLITVSAVI